MATFLEQKLAEAGDEIAPVARKMRMRFGTVAMVVRGQMHVTPDVMDRISKAIDEVRADREAR